MSSLYDLVPWCYKACWLVEKPEVEGSDIMSGGRLRDMRQTHVAPSPPNAAPDHKRQGQNGSRRISPLFRNVISVAWSLAALQPLPLLALGSHSKLASRSDMPQDWDAGAVLGKCVITGSHGTGFPWDLTCLRVWGPDYQCRLHGPNRPFSPRKARWSVHIACHGLPPVPKQAGFLQKRDFCMQLHQLTKHFGNPTPHKQDIVTVYYHSRIVPFPLKGQKKWKILHNAPALRETDGKYSQTVTEPGSNFIYPQTLHEGFMF